MGRPSRAETARGRPVPKDWKRSSLGQRVDYICTLRGWSLTKLGQRSGHDPGVVAKLSRRTETVAGTPGMLDSVAKAAGVNVEWLTYGRGPIESLPNRGMLKEHPNWQTVLAEAHKYQRGIPDEFWELAGETVFPTPPNLDWQLVIGMVRELYSAHQRFLEEGSEQGSQVPAQNVDGGESQGAVITHAQWGGARRHGKPEGST